MWMDSMITAEEARNRIRSIREERERKRLEAEQRAKLGIPLNTILGEIDRRIKEEYTFIYVYGFITQEAYNALKEAGYTIYRATYTRTDMRHEIEEYTTYSCWTGKSTKKTRLKTVPETTVYYLTVVSWDPTDIGLMDFLSDMKYAEV